MRWKCTDTAKALCKAKSTTHSIHYATMLTKLCFSCQWPCCADSDPTVLSVTLLCCQWPYCAVSDPTLLSVTLLCCQWTYFVLPLPLMSCLWSYSAVNDPTVLSMTLLCCQWPYYAVSDLTVLVSAPFHGTICNQTWKMSQNCYGSVGVSGACTFTFSVFCGCHGITL